MSIRQKTFSTFVATFAVALALALSVAPMAAKKMKPEPSPAQLQNDLRQQRVARGKYIVSTAGCHDCHTPWKMGPKGPEPDMTLALSGHPESFKLPPPPKLGEGPWVWSAVGTNTAFAGPWGVSYTANLTPDKLTGLGIWTEDIFIKTIRTGRHWGVSRPIPPAHALVGIPQPHRRGPEIGLRLPAHDQADPQPGAAAAAASGRMNEARRRSRRESGGVPRRHSLASCGYFRFGTLVQPTMKHLLIALTVVAVATPLFACINTYGTDLQGKAVPTFFEGKDLVDYLTNPHGPDWRAQKKKLSRNLSQASIEQQNDYAAALLHFGEIQPALAILVRIEQTRPGLYATATNLGTAYELAGKNEQALGWIRAGIHRNPGSHQGSEWLHVAILEAKLAMAGNPDWLRTRSVLGLDFGPDPLPRMPARFPSGNNGKPLDARETRQAIHFQMAERLQFVPPPDPIVGDLLFDYANLLMLTETMENAAAIYELAIRYDTPRAALAKERMAQARGIVKRGKK